MKLIGALPFASSISPSSILSERRRIANVYSSEEFHCDKVMAVGGANHLRRDAAEGRR
jgi:hypothetical protein